MTVRILSDVLPLQFEPSRHRGIGQYTYGVIRTLLSEPVSGQAHILMGNGHLLPPPPLPEDAGNWRLYYGDLPVPGHGTTEPIQPQSYIEYWQGHIDHFAPQVFHIHSPFEFAFPPHGSYQRVSTVYTLYDMIPLIFSKIYMTDPRTRAQYDYVCNQAKESAGIITISESARGDIVQFLGVAPEKVHVAYPGPSPLFQHAPVRSETVAAVRHKWNLRDGFVLSVTGYDYRKNLEGILNSYARLDVRLRREYPLALVCNLSHEHATSLRNQAAELGILDQLVLTNYVSDADLLALYSIATVQFFPALYEGFGMPVLDAMIAGVPVITANVSSLPEVIGDAGVLVNPHDVEEMTFALTEVLTSDTKRQEMRSAGLDRAPSFSWSRSAEVFRQVYRELGQLNAPVETVYPLVSSGPLEHLAFVSPMPPQKSGIADFSASLVGAMRERIKVTVFVDAEVLDEVRQHVPGPVESVARLPQMTRAGEFDAVLYQVGNASFHYFQLPYLIGLPGVVEMHDGILHGLMWDCYVVRGNPLRYYRELSYAHGKPGYDYAQEAMASSGAIASPDVYTLTLNRRVTNHAMGVIVHNHWAARSVAEHNTNVPLKLIYLPVSEQENAAHLDAARARQKLGIPLDQVVIATFGRLVFTKRLDVIVRVFARLVKDIPNVRLCMVGQLESPLPGHVDISELVQKFGLADSVTVTGYIDETTFVDYMAATDIALNLRYPHAGETSATLMRLLNAGIPTITSNIGPFADLPDDCCWKVDVDASEEELLYAYLVRLLKDKALLAQMRQNAIRFVQQNIPTWDSVVDIYFDYIQQVMAMQKPFLPVTWEVNMLEPVVVPQDQAPAKKEGLLLRLRRWMGLGAKPNV